VSYPALVHLVGATPVFIRGEEANDFRMTPEQVRRAITARTRALVLNSPSNPGGFTYPREDLAAIAAAVDGNEIVVFADEIYDRLRFERDAYVSFAAISESAFRQTVTFNGASKTFAMTGWRIGYAAGPQWIIDAMAKLQSHATSGMAPFVQLALAAALDGDQACVEAMRSAYAARAGFVHQRLSAIPGVRCVKPTGAFYAFPNVSATYARLGVSGSVEFAERLLCEAAVAVVPGIAFGSDDHVRVSYAASMESLQQAMDRIERFLASA
jgi:aspartate aminotransferase